MLLLGACLGGAFSMAQAQAQKVVFAMPYSMPTPTPQQPAAAAIPCDIVRPSADAVAAAVNAVDIKHWKLSRDKKEEMLGDVDSIQRDLVDTLPVLIQQAKATPRALAPEWAVMQNVDALYDVLVRVTTTASLSAQSGEAGQLLDAENQLGLTRKSLTDQLVAAAGSQDSTLAMLQMKLASLTAANGGGRIIVDNTDSAQKKAAQKEKLHPQKTVHKVTRKAVKKVSPPAASVAGSANPTVPAVAPAAPPSSH